MRNKIILVLGLGVSLILTNAILAFSQEQTASEPAVSEARTESETQWLWGEVVSVDILKNELVVKYLDYETDQEKEMTIAIDSKTTYENVKSAGDIKQLDTVSIDYIVSPEGKNLAKKISIEKPEELETPQQETSDNSIATPDTVTGKP
jgi:hypothetical protein